MAMGAPHSVAVVDGLRIAYDKTGHGMPAVVLIHGVFASRSYFAAQVAHLARRHQVISVDLRGHGDSDIPDASVRVADFVEDVVAVCQAADVDQAVLCGHSILGAVVAAKVAAARPDLVTAVVLLDAAMLPAPVRAQTRAGLIPALQGSTWLDALQGYLGRTFGPHDPAATKAKVMEDLSRVPRHLAAPLMDGIMSLDVAAELAAVDCPLLYVHAKAPADLDWLRQLKPDALVGSVVGSGHYLMLVVPRQVNAMLDRFLQIISSNRATAGEPSGRGVTDGPAAGPASGSQG